MEDDGIVALYFARNEQARDYPKICVNLLNGVE